MSYLYVKRSGQRGFTLVLVLVFMVVLTMLGLAGMRATKLQEQMASARYERVTSVATANAGIADGRDYVFSALDPTAPSSKVQGYEDVIGSTNEGWTIQQWVTANTDWFSGPRVIPFGSGSGVTYSFQRGIRSPNYMVQEVYPSQVELGAPVSVYRVTTRGEGGRSENSTYLQAIYRFSASIVN